MAGGGPPTGVSQGEGPSYGELMNGTLGASFFGEKTREQWRSEGKDAEGVPTPDTDADFPVGWDHNEVLPLPSGDDMARIRRERDAAPPGTRPEDMGPVAKRWYGRVRVWLRKMRSKYQPGRKHVTGSWRKNWKPWNRRLRRLPEKRRKYVMRLLLQGVELPWDRKPKRPLRKLSNHVRLGERADVVWSTINEMLMEGSVEAHDCQGRSDEDVLPQGMFSIRWVKKGDSEKVRITLVLPSKVRSMSCMRGSVVFGCESLGCTGCGGLVWLPSYCGSKWWLEAGGRRPTPGETSRGHTEATGLTLAEQAAVLCPGLRSR